MTLKFCAGLFGAVLLLLAQQPTAPPKPRGPGGGGPPRASRPPGRKVVLAWADTRNGIAQHDSTSHALAMIERLGYESGLYDTYIRTDSHIISKTPKMTTGQPASGGPNLNNVDAIFFLGHREIELSDAQKADLLSFVRDDGKGFVAGHTASTAFASWPEFGEMLGARYDGHPWGNVNGRVIVEDSTFPATKHFPAAFDIRDEFYQPKDYSRDKLRVLLRLDTSRLPDNDQVHIKGGDFPLAWAKSYGKGRVFYATFGHDYKIWDDKDIYQMYFEAIKWALGLSPADVTPRALAPGVASKP